MLTFKKPKIKDLLPPPVRAAHGEYSMILSSADDPARPTPELIHKCLAAIHAALDIDLSSLSKRLARPPYFPDIWPGEHYKLLAAFAKTLRPSLIVEIGTATGLSALALKQCAPGQIVTYDVIPWNNIPTSVLTKADFGPSFSQIVGNLGDPLFFASQLDVLKKAELLFIDATHDGHLERTLLDHLKTVPFEKPPLVLFDDIRVWTMLKMWREIKEPKLDLTSFGHWSGTGAVQL
ncbi:MAG: methyltransferase [Verrucomicrobiota bacterium]|nr:methyltransferase [Verrucomicrobiota bacterium]